MSFRDALGSKLVNLMASGLVFQNKASGNRISQSAKDSEQSQLTESIEQLAMILLAEINEQNSIRLLNIIQNPTKTAPALNGLLIANINSSSSVFFVFFASQSCFFKELKFISNFKDKESKTIFDHISKKDSKILSLCWEIVRLRL